MHIWVAGVTVVPAEGLGATVWIVSRTRASERLQHPRRGRTVPDGNASNDAASVATVACPVYAPDAANTDAGFWGSDLLRAMFAFGSTQANPWVGDADSIHVAHRFLIRSAIVKPSRLVATAEEESPAAPQSSTAPHPPKTSAATRANMSDAVHLRSAYTDVSRSILRSGCTYSNLNI